MRVDRRDQHPAGGDVLGDLGERVERRRGDVDRRLERRVQHLGDQHERDPDDQRQQLDLLHPDGQRRGPGRRRDGEVDPHVPLGAEHVDDPLEREVEGLDDVGTRKPPCLSGSSAAPRRRPLGGGHRLPATGASSSTSWSWSAEHPALVGLVVVAREVQYARGPASRELLAPAHARLGGLAGDLGEADHDVAELALHALRERSSSRRSGTRARPSPRPCRGARGSARGSARRRRTRPRARCPPARRRARQHAADDARARALGVELARHLARARPDRSPSASRPGSARAL